MRRTIEATAASRATLIAGVVCLSLWSFGAPASAQPQPQPTGGGAPLPSLEEQAEQTVSRMVGIGARIREDLRTARAQRDAVKALCLSDKLTQVDVAIRSARERQQALTLALGQHDTTQAGHEAEVLGVLRQRAEGLRGEAAQCIGTPDPARREREAKDQRSFEDPFADQEDPTLPPDVQIILDPPACVSCFH